MNVLTAAAQGAQLEAVRYLAGERGTRVVRRLSSLLMKAIKILSDISSLRHGRELPRLRRRQRSELLLLQASILREKVTPLHRILGNERRRPITRHIGPIWHRRISSGPRIKQVMEERKKVRGNATEQNVKP